MTDKPDGKRWRWRWAIWIVALLVLYPVSMVIVGLGCGWLERLGIIGPPPNRVVQTVYAPLIWLLENSPEAEKAAKSTEKTLEPIAPKP
ncbi:MAG TPA: hypothetical protein VGP76_03980 [Planctomycetaceae bacterium]|jgi:hypothetical protein|nr:hypothetical protein [Planctomycetaceae bacterium]